MQLLREECLSSYPLLSLCRLCRLCLSVCLVLLGSGLPAEPNWRAPMRAHQSINQSRQEKAVLHCNLRVRWKVASDLRFRAAISEPKTPSFCGISGDFSCDCAIWCAKVRSYKMCCASLPNYWIWIQLMWRGMAPSWAGLWWSKTSRRTIQQQMPWCD